MSEINMVQWKILDSVYFVEPFEKILEESGETEYVVADELKTMIRKGWIQVMEFDPLLGDFKKSNIYDSDNMRAFHYLATKEGLMKHNQK